MLLAGTFLIVQQQQQRQTTQSEAASLTRDEIPDAQQPFVEDAKRGLRWGDLRKAGEGSPCEELIEVLDDKGKVQGCTHGPDPAPEGVDVTKSVQPLQLDQQDVQKEQSSTEVPQVINGSPVLQAPAAQLRCDGDGSSGYRVQAIYVRASDRPDRYNQFASSFVEYAKLTDTIFSESAAQTGGVRNLRFVTDSGCNLRIDRVVVPPSADDTFANLNTQLQSMGYNRNDRRYLLWVDATIYCGLAGGRTDYPLDDRASQSNVWNGSFPAYARVDSGCWGGWTEAHEIMHILGAVQLSAPHTSGHLHCTDQFDVMCYKDSPEVTMFSRCTSSAESYHFDCGKDDYFHTNPPAGSYLATHWNTANSRFLINGGNGSGSGECGPAGCCSQVFSGARCQNTSNSCSGGYETNYCPGGNDYKCCKGLPQPPPPPPPTPTVIPTKAPTPTMTPTKTPTPTATRTPTPTKTPTPTPTRIPTTTVTPIVTQVVQGTRVSLDLFLHGIGSVGDNANPGAGGNTNPLRGERQVTIEIFDEQNKSIKKVVGSVFYNASSGSFKGEIAVPGVASGVYFIKVKFPQSLQRSVPGFHTITSGAATVLPQTTLVNGDVNNDNVLNIFDYQMLIGCYSDFMPATDCTPDKKLQADIDDDGEVNHFDVNLFLREFGTRKGQ